MSTSRKLSQKKFLLFISFLTTKKMWISMFFIKFLGKIENIFGDASNIFNFTLEFNEKHFNPHFLFLLKTKKTVEKVFGRVTYSGIATPHCIFCNWSKITF